MVAAAVVRAERELGEPCGKRGVVEALPAAARTRLARIAGDDRRASATEHVERVRDRHRLRVGDRRDRTASPTHARELGWRREHARAVARNATARDGHRAAIEIGEAGDREVMRAAIEADELGRAADRRRDPREQRRALPREREIGGREIAAFGRTTIARSPASTAARFAS